MPNAKESGYTLMRQARLDYHARRVKELESQQRLVYTIQPGCYHCGHHKFWKYDKGPIMEGQSTRFLCLNCRQVVMFIP